MTAAGKPQAVVFDIGRVLIEWDLRHLFAPLIDDPAQHLLAFRDNDVLRACVAVTDKGNGLAYLGMLTVDPHRQAAGLGRLILAAAEDHAAAFGARRVEMTVIAQRAEVPLREQQLDKQGRAYATGRRKDATARVWVKPGTGKVTINGRDQEVYFARPTLRLIIDQPFTITERQGQYDVIATVKGGGLSGQAGAVKHGIAQALSKYEPVLRATVKAAGFLTRDSRVVERKKYGRAKARRSFQFSKR